MIRLEMKKCNTILEDKQQKYSHTYPEFLTSGEMLPVDQSRLIEQAKFTYCPLGKALEKETQFKIKEEQK